MTLFDKADHGTGRFTALARMLSASALLILVPLSACAEFFVSVQDGKQMLVGGANNVVPGTDTLSVIELKGGKLSIVAELPVPVSVIGPPTSLAVTSDGALALVTAGFKRDPVDAAKVVVDDTLTVVDLKSQPPRVVDTLHVGKGAAGVSIDTTGTLALVANHEEGTVSVLSIAGSTVNVVDKVTLGDAKSGPMHVAITPDGKRALVSRDGDHRVSVLDINAASGKVTLAKRDLFAGLRPDCIDIRAQGDLAVVANIGRGQGDSDTVSLIDLTVEPPRVVDTISVGQTPESAFFMPGGGYVGVNAMNGSNKPVSSSFHSAGGQFLLLRVEGKRLVKVASTSIGVWPQGLAFSADGKHALVQNAGDQNIQLVSVNGETLTDTGQLLKLKGALASVMRVR